MGRPNHRQTHTAIKLTWFMLLLFSGIVACQEETTPVNNPPVEPPAPGFPQTIPLPSVNSDMPNPSTTSGRPSNHARFKIGEVMSIDDKIYMIKDSENMEVTVEATSMTLVDEGIEVGDTAEVRYLANEEPTAIRKVRGTT